MDDGRTGFVTKAHNAKDFARAIERMSSDSSLRARMGQEARQQVIDRSWPGAFRKSWQATEL